MTDSIKKSSTSTSDDQSDLDAKNVEFSFDNKKPDLARASNKLRKSSLKFLLKTQVKQEIIKRRQTFKDQNNIFSMFREDGTGEVGVKELELVLDAFSIHPSKDELETLINDIDEDGSGQIDITEFLFLITNKLLSGWNEDELIQGFKQLDLDGGGSISRDEMRQILSTIDIDDLNEDQIDELINEADEDGSGEVDFEEFISILKEDC